ncbi:MAG: chalcone isomerase family protein [Rubrivivax sp.]|nr:chalcone isomerase family protein [Rubrivivax sp.]
MPLTRRPLLISFAALLLAPVGLRAQESAVLVEGHTFDGRALVAGSELLLNGTGVRAVAWFKGFAAGLYLRARSTTAAQVLAQAGPKRLQLRMLHDVPSKEFTKAFRKGLQRNAPAEELPGLSARMLQFEALVDEVGTVRKGDLINLDLEPGRGTAFSLNGTLRGEVIAGDDFYAALLRSFVGNRPYDRELRAGLLGRQP